MFGYLPMTLLAVLLVPAAFADGGGIQIGDSPSDSIVPFVADAEPLPPTYASEGGAIEVPVAKVRPKIDGRFTSEAEWGDASITNFQSNGHSFYLLTKQDRNFVYLMLDGVDFQTDPKSTDVSVRYQSTICFDVNNDKGSKRQPDDFCYTHTVNNEFGKWVMTQFAPKKFDSGGNPSHLDLPPWSVRSGWGFGSENDRFEQSDHLVYEAVIQKKILRHEGGVGFTFEVYFDTADDDLVQLVDGVEWPFGSDKEEPATWGTLVLRQVPCQEGLELVLRAHGGGQACVKAESREKMVQRGLAQPA